MESFFLRLIYIGLEIKTLDYSESKSELGEKLVALLNEALKKQDIKTL